MILKNLKSWLLQSNASESYVNCEAQQRRWKLRQLHVPIQSSAIDRDGTIYAGFSNDLFVSRDLGQTFEIIYTFEGQGLINATLTFLDSNNRLFFSSRHKDCLYLSQDCGLSFDTVLDELGGSVRGFDEDSRGNVFAGVYSRRGPAVLYRSKDARVWEVAGSWAARHIHDVRVNRRNDWLYVVVGEGDPKATTESHAVYRSKDEGRTFTKIFQGVREGKAAPRPLFLPINFVDKYLILGTDHSSGGNYICRILDCGEDKLHSIEERFQISDHQGETRYHPYFHFIEWVGGVLVAGIKGENEAYLLKSTDGVSWSLIEGSRVSNMKGRHSTYLSATRGTNRDWVLIAGVPGVMLGLLD